MEATDEFATRNAAQQGEQALWKLERHGDRVALVSPKGRYLRALPDHRGRADASFVSGLPKYAEDHGGCLVGDSADWGEEELFTVVLSASDEGPAWSFATGTGMYLSGWSDGSVLQMPHQAGYERFFVFESGSVLWDGNLDNLPALVSIQTAHDKWLTAPSGAFATRNTVRLQDEQRDWCLERHDDRVALVTPQGAYLSVLPDHRDKTPDSFSHGLSDDEQINGGRLVGQSRTCNETELFTAVALAYDQWSFYMEGGIYLSWSDRNVIGMPRQFVWESFFVLTPSGAHWDGKLENLPAKVSIQTAHRKWLDALPQQWSEEFLTKAAS